VAHITEDDLEKYAMRTLLGAESGLLEGHLLACSECRDRVQTEIDFVTAMRGVAAEIREQGREPDGVEERTCRGNHHG
jgi:hypothetical protein